MTHELSDDQVQRIQSAVFAGRTIEAVKLYRVASGRDLAEAAAFIGALEEQLRQRSPERFTAARASAGCIPALFMLLFATAIIFVLAAIFIVLAILMK